MEVRSSGSTESPTLPVPAEPEGVESATGMPPAPPDLAQEASSHQATPIPSPIVLDDAEQAAIRPLFQKRLGMLDSLGQAERQCKRVRLEQEAASLAVGTNADQELGFATERVLVYETQIAKTFAASQAALETAQNELKRILAVRGVTDMDGWTLDPARMIAKRTG